MNEPKATLRVYTVVDVFRGFAEEAKSFVRYADARAYFRKLRKGRNLDIDDVQLFEDAIELPARLAPPKPITPRPVTKAPQ
jgi:hypothetical protein